MRTPTPTPALLFALLLGALPACIVVPARGYAPPPPPGAPPPVASPYVSQEQAIDIAFQAAHDRGLGVDHVRHVHQDGRGRWHVELRGHGDRARLLIDGRDGRLLRGAFKGEDRDRDDQDDD